MHTKNQFIYLATSLLAITVLAFLTLSSDFVKADDTSVDTIRITVPTSCTLNSTLDTAHTANMTPGQYKTDIGTTTFQVLCNDPGGFDVYAIGYSNDTYGTTTMINSSDSTIYFDTGTGQSGNSQWAMKLTPVTGTYAPTIQNGFNNYHVVPTTYTKVATFASNTDGTVGSKVQSTYAVYVSTSQIAGTYTGKVRYTIVHPQDIGAPPAPVLTNSGYISYNPNATGVADTMGDQSIRYSSNFSELWASNFQRPGYGFAGWSDKFDWVLNANDASGNGTGENAGYHIYGPNSRASYSVGQYYDPNPGLSLYAVWVPSAGYMQDFTTADCTAMSTNQVTALKDKRDNQVYAVAKLKDDNCWMIENLRLANQGLSVSDTHNPLSLNGLVTLKNNDGLTYNHLSASTDALNWCTEDSAACYDVSMLSTENTTNAVSNMTTEDSNVYSYGNYYNWYSATGGKGTYSVTTGNTDGDICPANWHLPTGSSSGEYNYLASMLGGSYFSYFSAYPANYIWSSVLANNSISYRGESAAYATSTAYDNQRSLILMSNRSNSMVSPGSNYGGGAKNRGRTIRCIFGS